jgi:hypothetical protein
MKNIALGAALVLTVMSWSAMAEERDAMHGKPTIEEQCKAMAEQHGMKGDKVDAWVQKCLEMAEKMKHNREMSDNNGMHDGNGMEDSEAEDSGMSGEGK